MHKLKLCLLGAVCLATAPSTLTAAVITYLSGPNYCTTAPGYSDLPFCTIPMEIPLGSFPVPPAGSTYLDPNFGGLVRMLTGPANLHSYSQPTPVSAHNLYIGTRHLDDGRASILDFNTGRTLLDPLPFGDAWVWDAYSDDIHYRIDGTRIIKTVISTTAETVLVDYSQTVQHFSYITSGGSTDTSKDNWMSFWAPGEHQICAVDLNTVRTYCADYAGAEAASRVGWSWIDYSMMSKGVDSTNGKRYVLLMGAPAMGMWSVNLAAGKLDFENRGGDNFEWGSNQDGYCDPNEDCLQAPHADVMEDSNGKQYLVTGKGIENPCSLQIVTMDLSKGRFFFWPDWAGGGMKTIMNAANCGDFWPDYDIGCAKQAPTCVISYYRNSNRDPADLTTPFGVEPHRDQIAIMRGNGQEIKYLATTRSITFVDDNYWSQPRAAITPDGQYVIFDSNYGSDGGERVAILSTQAPVNPVQAISVAPAAAAVAAQTFTLTYSDAAGTTDLATAWIWIKASANSASSNSCMMMYDRTAGILKLADNSGSGWLQATPGAAVTIQNSQCSVNAAAVTVSQTYNNLVLSIPVVIKPAYAGARQVWLEATGNAGTSGWQQRGTWNIPPPVVTNTSVTPASGSASSQTFSAVWTDSAGAADLASATFWIRADASSPALSSCSITWTRATGQFSAPAAAQCSLDTTSARAVDSGNTVTLTLPIAFRPSFSGPKGIWISAAGSVSGSTLQQIGSWTVRGGVVTNTAVSPNTGSGMSSTFNAAWSDTAGSADISSASVWITTSASVSTASSCYVTWTRATGQFTLSTDSQCTLNTASAVAIENGNVLTLSLPVTFKSSYGGAKGIWMTAAGSNDVSAPQQLGTWSIPAATAYNTSVTPNAGTGASSRFVATWTDTAGAADLVSLSFRITPGGSGAAAGCNVVWTAATNRFTVLDNSGAPSTVMQNSQCSLDRPTRAVSGNNIALTLPLTFNPSFGGVRELWMSAAGTLASSSWQKLGAWTVSGPPVISAVSASPGTGQAASQTFTLAWSDTAGAGDLVSTWFWFTQDFNSPAAYTCFGYYEPGSNQIKLLNDAGNLWSGAAAGSSSAVQNSQCSIDTASAAVTKNGPTLSLSMAVTFQTSFAGSKDLWMFASGLGGSSDWKKLATWTVPSAIVKVASTPVDAVSVTPATGAGASQTFTLVFSDTAGAADLTSAWFWITPTFNGSAANTCFGSYDRIAGQFKLMSDTGATWITAVPGAAVAMENGSCAFDGAISATANGNMLTLTLPIHFKPGFAGVKEIWTFAAGRSVSSDWKKLATWTVQ